MKSMFFLALLVYPAVVSAQGVVASGTSEIPGLEGHFRVEIPGLSKSACLQEGFALKRELRLGMFEDISDYLSRILDRRGNPIDLKHVDDRFQARGGWALGEEHVNHAYCEAFREELAERFELPLNTSWRAIVAKAR